MRYFDDLSMNWVIETVSRAGGYLLGRGTYEVFAAHWPNASEEEQVLAEPLNMRPKYVASTTLVEPLEWLRPRAEVRTPARRAVDVPAAASDRRLRAATRRTPRQDGRSPPPARQPDHRG
jgi:dihydrofolate reductase